MNDESDSRMVRLPVRDEPAPQRAAQEGDLPPLLTDERIERIAKTIPLEGCDRQTMGWGIGYSKESDFLEPNVPKAAFPFARAIEAEVRTAIAAAGGGVPKGGWEALHTKMWAGLSECRRFIASRADESWAWLDQLVAEADPALLASSPQPEAAPAVAQVPREALMEARDMLESWTSYVPPYFAQKHGLNDDFAKLDAWIAAAPEAPAQAAPSAGEVERVLRSFEIAGPDADGLLWLVLHGNGTTGKAMFQLGLPDRLAGQVALMLEQDRRAALSHKEPQR